MPVGPKGAALNSSYNNRDSREYKEDLGYAVVNFARMVPDGLLVFFPSYGVLKSCTDFWKNTCVGGTGKAAALLTRQPCSSCCTCLYMCLSPHARLNIASSQENCLVHEVLPNMKLHSACAVGWDVMFTHNSGPSRTISAKFGTRHGCFRQVPLIDFWYDRWQHLGAHCEAQAACVGA